MWLPCPERARQWPTMAAMSLIRVRPCVPLLLLTACTVAQRPPRSEPVWLRKEPAMAKKTAKGKAPKAAKRQSTPKAEPAALVPGTVLRKLDRKGKTRCECTVEAEGYRYKGTVYGSLSGAAAAAAKDVGLPRHELQRLGVLGSDPETSPHFAHRIPSTFRKSA